MIPQSPPTTEQLPFSLEMRLRLIRECNVGWYLILYGLKKIVAKYVRLDEIYTLNGKAATRFVNRYTRYEMHSASTYIIYVCCRGCVR